MYSFANFCHLVLLDFCPLRNCLVITMGSPEKMQDTKQSIQITQMLWAVQQETMRLSTKMLLLNPDIRAAERHITTYSLTKLSISLCGPFEDVVNGIRLHIVVWGIQP